jgi:hypothetical protein
MDFLEFEDNGRKLTCRSASSPATPGTSWWWLDVTGESQRYAAFRTDPSDTPENLRTRMIAHYAQLLVDRARPREIRPRWSRPGTPLVKPAEQAESTESPTK